MKIAPPTHQCYLLVGSGQKVQKETQNIISSYGLTIKKNSPDISVISPLANKFVYTESKSTTKSHPYISIDQIRQMKKEIFQKPLAQEHKLVIIEEAEMLTPEAQNALLKILEEPPKHAIIILKVRNKSGILPTVRSRVVTKYIPQEKKHQVKISAFWQTKNMLTLLEEIAELPNPAEWLDEQISALHQILLTNIKNADRKKAQKIQKGIERCIQAKKMLEANINSKFALSNLIFGLKLKD